MFQKILRLIIWKKGLKEVVKLFYFAIDPNDILDIHKYLMKITWYEIIFGLIKKIFIELLAGLVNGSNNTKYVSLNNQKFKIQRTLINLHPDEYSHEFHYHLFSVKLDRWAGSCNTINVNYLSNKACVPNKTEDLNLNIFNMIKGINEWKTLAKHISCKCRYKFDETKCKSNQWLNNNKCRCECKNHNICEKEYV